MELEKSVRMMERNVMAMEVATFFFILIIPKATTFPISLIIILSIIVTIRIIFIMDANLGGKPRGRRLWGKAEVRGAEAAEHSGRNQCLQWYNDGSDTNYEESKDADDEDDVPVQLMEQKRWLEHELEEIKLKIQNDKSHPLPDMLLDWDSLRWW